MIGIVAGMMIGLCLVIMEQGARKAHITTKGRSIDKQPRVKVGDRVRITQSYSFYSQPGTCGVVVHTHSTTNSFEMKTDTSYGTLSIAEVCGDEWEILQPTKEQTMTQRQFKPGDRVRIMGQPSHFIGNYVGKTGAIGDRWMGADKAALYTVMYDHEFGSNTYPAEYLKLLPKTLNDLIEGDVVLDKDDTDDTMTVVHVLKPGLYVIEDDDAEPLLLYTATQLKNLDYVPQQDPEEYKTCLTVSEVAKKLGLNPDTLHIVANKKAA